MTWVRGRSYSEDLRSRVLAAVDAGMAVRAIAPVFRVSISYVYKALARRRRTGESGASARRGHRPRKLTPLQEAALATHVTANPDLTLAKLQAWLESAHEVRLSSAGMWTVLDRLGLSFKKNPARRRAGSPGRRRAAHDVESVAAVRRS